MGGLSKESLLLQAREAGQLFQQAYETGSGGSEAESRAKDLCADLAASIRAQIEAEEEEKETKGSAGSGVAKAAPVSRQRRAEDGELQKEKRADTATRASRAQTRSLDYSRFDRIVADESDIEDDRSAEELKRNTHRLLPGTTRINVDTDSPLDFGTESSSSSSHRRPQVKGEALQHQAEEDPAQQQPGASSPPPTQDKQSLDEQAPEIAHVGSTASADILESTPVVDRPAHGDFAGAVAPATACVTEQLPSLRERRLDYSRFDRLLAEESDSDKEGQTGKLSSNEAYKIAHRIAGVIEDVKGGEQSSGRTGGGPAPVSRARRREQLAPAEKPLPAPPERIGSASSSSACVRDGAASCPGVHQPHQLDLADLDDVAPFEPAFGTQVEQQAAEEGVVPAPAPKKADAAQRSSRYSSDYSRFDAVFVDDDDGSELCPDDVPDLTDDIFSKRTRQVLEECEKKLAPKLPEIRKNVEAMLFPDHSKQEGPGAAASQPREQLHAALAAKKPPSPGDDKVPLAKSFMKRSAARRQGAVAEKGSGAAAGSSPTPTSTGVPDRPATQPPALSVTTLASAEAAVAAERTADIVEAAAASSACLASLDGMD